MSTDENKAVVRRLHKMLEDSWRTGDFSSMGDVFDQNVTSHIANMPPEVLGLQGFQQMMPMFRKAFPDFHFRVDHMLAEGDKVMYLIEWEGTHKGELMGIPPTGKQVKVTDTHIERIASGKIVGIGGPHV